MHIDVTHLLINIYQGHIVDTQMQWLKNERSGGILIGSNPGSPKF